MKKYKFLILFISLSSTLFSQNYKGKITNIEKDGLHKILLTPEIRAASKENFNTIRVKQNKEEISYVLMEGSNKTFSTFNEIEITSKKTIKDSITSIVIENKELKKQESISLQIANTKISKKYTIYGSDDGENWFGLIANQNLHYNSSSKNKTSFEKTIYYPLNTYKFIRIDFNDKHSLPINILKVGNYVSKHLKQEPIAIKNFKYENSAVKEKKVTQLKFKADTKQKIDVISFTINTPYFLREAKVIVRKTRKIKKRVETYDEVIASFSLNSKNKNTFAFNNLNEKEFIIEIDNQDNSPLVIENVELYQKPLYLITNLKKDTTYEILIDSTLFKPSYDLGNFISNKTENISEAKIINLQEIQKKKAVVKEKSFWQSNTFMWICIVLGGLLVVYFAISLLKDISKNEA